MFEPLEHFDDQGRPRMLDVSDKPPTVRVAVARGRVRMAAVTLDEALTGQTTKGGVLRIAEVAGIMAAKRTSELIPLCHPLSLDSVQVSVDPEPSLPGLVISARVATTAKTGVEMEALTAVSVACLTVYDMLKSSDRGMIIECIALVSKQGGKSGPWTAEHDQV